MKTNFIGFKEIRQAEPNQISYLVFHGVFEGYLGDWQNLSSVIYGNCWPQRLTPCFKYFIQQVSFEKKSGTSHWEVSIPGTKQRCDNVSTPYSIIQFLFYYLSSGHLHVFYMYRVSEVPIFSYFFLFFGLPPIFSYFFRKFLVFPIFLGFNCVHRNILKYMK